MKKVVLLGSTGSIGTSTIKVAEDLPDRIQLVGLAAGNNSKLLAEQTLKHQPRTICLQDLAKAGELQRMFGDAGLTLVHENCGNYGGMSWSHSLKLLEHVPGLKLVYDTGNPVHDDDYSLPQPRPKQSSWEFYSHVKEHVAYVHVKDGVFDSTGNTQWCFPGKGQGDVLRILTDLLASGYSGGISIEPHMHAGLPDPALTREENCYCTYIEYGRRLENLIAKARASLK